MLMKKLTWEGSYASSGTVRALAFSDPLLWDCIYSKATATTYLTLAFYATAKNTLRYMD